MTVVVEYDCDSDARDAVKVRRRGNFASRTSIQASIVVSVISVSILRDISQQESAWGCDIKPQTVD